MINDVVRIIGAGLAGCEAALQLSNRGIKCRLEDIKPSEMTPAHKKAGDFAELVCSNSLKGDSLDTASGLLKQELRVLNSYLIAAADECRVPAGGALAVDRGLFSRRITDLINSQKNIEFVTKRAEDFCLDEYTVIATGPLTMPPLFDNIKAKLGQDFLHFFDAAAPIISAESIDYSKTFRASRYNKGEGEYINCPLNKDEYTAFIEALQGAKTAALKDFEEEIRVFEGCMPVEVMAKRGGDSLRFGPMKPVGLYDENGKRPYAVVQLRQENAAGEMFNLVGFQTNLTFAEQKRVFGLIPALKNAEFLRYGVMHRNSFVDAPKCLRHGFSLTAYPKTYVAGQLSGVEGYCESIMSGLISALDLFSRLNEGEGFIPPHDTMSGALCRYLSIPNANFQPMNANFGLLPPPEGSTIKDKKLRKQAMALRALSSLESGR